MGTGIFNSSDLIVVFQAGEYEDGLCCNSTWHEGDWNGDAEFDSADLVMALRVGGFVQTARPVVLPPVRLTVSHRNGHDGDSRRSPVTLEPRHELDDAELIAAKLAAAIDVLFGQEILSRIGRHIPAIGSSHDHAARSLSMNWTIRHVIATLPTAVAQWGVHSTGSLPSWLIAQHLGAESVSPSRVSWSP